MKNPWKVLLLTALAVVGCGRLNTDAEDAADAIDTTETTSNESALMDLASASSEDMTAACGLSSEEVATAMAARVKVAGAKLKDPACVTVTRMGNAVDYAMNACTGRWGKVVVTGTVHVVYTANQDCSVDAVATGRGVQVNKATIDLDATAHYSKSSTGVETIVVNTHSTGGGQSVQLDHSGSYTVTRDLSTGELCRTLEGSWSTNWSAARGMATTSTTANGIKKCGDACPVAGGEVVHHGFAGRTVTVTFDGSAAAQWESSKGKSGTINLECGQ